MAGAEVRLKDAGSLRAMGANDRIPIDGPDGEGGSGKMGIDELKGTIGEASSSVDGLMAKEDKELFDLVAAKFDEDNRLITDGIADGAVVGPKLGFLAGKIGSNIIENPNLWGPKISAQLTEWDYCTAPVIAANPLFHSGKTIKFRTIGTGTVNIIFTVAEADLESLQYPINSGDKVKFGLFVCAEDISGTPTARIYHSAGSGDYHNLTTSVMWIESILVTYSSGDIVFHLVIESQPTDMYIYISGITLKKVGDNGEEWLGYEDNPVWNAQNLTNIKSIACWGDSLTYGGGNGIAELLAPIMGVPVYNGGIGGQLSCHIRDRVLADTEHIKDFHIFWVGHNDCNDYNVVEIVIYNLRLMIEHINHTRFLVLGLINNNTEYEERGTEINGLLLDLDKRLEESYPNQFLNVRRYLINNYHYQDTYLISSFVLPEVGSNVTIEVNTTYWMGEGLVIAVGRLGTSSFYVNGLCNYFTIIEVVDETHVTIRHDTNNIMDPGQTVWFADTTVGGTTSHNYVRVMFRQDVIDYNRDTVPQGLRIDGMHLTVAGYQMVAQKIADIINKKN